MPVGRQVSEKFWCDGLMEYLHADSAMSSFNILHGDAHGVMWHTSKQSALMRLKGPSVTGYSQLFIFLSSFSHSALLSQNSAVDIVGWSSRYILFSLLSNSQAAVKRDNSTTLPHLMVFPAAYLCKLVFFSQASGALEEKAPWKHIYGNKSVQRRALSTSQASQSFRPAMRIDTLSLAMHHAQLICHSSSTYSWCTDHLLAILAWSLHKNIEKSLRVGATLGSNSEWELTDEQISTSQLFILTLKCRGLQMPSRTSLKDCSFSWMIHYILKLPPWLNSCACYYMLRFYGIILILLIYLDEKQDPIYWLQCHEALLGLPALHWLEPVLLLRTSYALPANSDLCTRQYNLHPTDPECLLYSEPPRVQCCCLRLFHCAAAFALDLDQKCTFMNFVIELDYYEMNYIAVWLLFFENLCPIFWAGCIARWLLRAQTCSTMAVDLYRTDFIMWRKKLSPSVRPLLHTHW